VSRRFFTPAELARIVGRTQQTVRSWGIERVPGTGRWVRFTAEAIDAAVRAGKCPGLTHGWLARAKAREAGDTSRSLKTKAPRKQTRSILDPDEPGDEPEVALDAPLFLGPLRVRK
jgi:hypothetical protein